MVADSYWYRYDWIYVWIGSITLETSKWIPNIGAIIKALIMVVIGVVAFIYAGKTVSPNDLLSKACFPAWGAGHGILTCDRI
jgi:hypothetical protein